MSRRSAATALPTERHDGLIVYRLWHPTGHQPDAVSRRRWGPLFRFDPHAPGATPAADPGRRGVWYAGEAFETAVREVHDRGLTSVEICARERLAALRLEAPARLIDLTDAMVDAGTVGLGDDTHTYEASQRWARRVYEDPASDGLRYWSARHRAPDGQRAGVNVALWDRAGVPAIVSELPMAHPGAWRRVLVILDRAGLGVVRVERCSRCSA